MITEQEKREHRLAVRLYGLGKPDVFAGVTDTDIDPDVIKRRMRIAILGVNPGQNIGHIVAFRKENGESITLERAFFLTYNEPLIRPMEAA